MKKKRFLKKNNFYAIKFPKKNNNILNVLKIYKIYYFYIYIFYISI